MLRARLPFFLAYARANNQPIYIDYIESTGTQYINTECIMTSDNQEVECEFQYTDSSSTQCLFGTLPGDNRGITAYTSNDANFYVHTGQPVVLRFYGFDYSAKHSLYVKAVVGQGVYGKLDNEEQTTALALTTINKSNPYFLFCRNNGTNNKPDTSFFRGRISKCKMYDNGVLVRDFRPCLHPQTFEACMYDMVTKQYFYNQGTGSFVPAPRFVEYLEFDGASYIDTGLFPNSNWRIESVWFATVSSKNIYSSNAQLKRIFARAAGGTWWFGDSTVAANNEKLPLNIVNTTVHDKNGVIFNGVSYAYDKQVDEFDASSRSLYLGALSGDSSASFEGRIYDFKIYDNDVLIQHLKPCLRGNTPCMFDMVEGKYYMNAGTGEFIAGGKMVDFDLTVTHAWINTENLWRPAHDSCSFVIPLTVGKRYKIVWQNANAMIDGMQNTIFRYGQTNDSAPNGQLLNDCVRTSPQDMPVAEITAVNKYLVVQIGSKLGDQIAKYELFKVYELINA